MAIVSHWLLTFGTVLLYFCYHHRYLKCMAPSRCIRSCASWPSSKRSQLLNSNLFSCIRRISRQELREFFDDSGSMSSRKMPTDEVNRRIFEGEFICFPHGHKVGFTANQVRLSQTVRSILNSVRFAQILYRVGPFYPQPLDGLNSSSAFFSFIIYFLSKLIVIWCPWE